MYTVYKTVNLVNKKYYVGVHKTTTPDDDYLGSGVLLKQAIQKYGKTNFKKEVLAIFENKNDAYELERTLVKICEESYNLKEGGEGGFEHLNDGSETHLIRAKAAATLGGKITIKAIRKRYAEDPEYRVYMHDKIKTGIRNSKTKSRRFTGKHHSAVSKRKIGEQNKKHQSGENNSQYGLKWITNGTDNAKIKSNDHLPEGWRFGRTIKNKHTYIQTG